MAAALVKSAQGSASTATVNPSFGSATTSGNLIVLAIAGDDYNGTPDSGWTQSAEMEQQTFHGGYLWWRISTGQTSFTYTIGSASFSSWNLMEFSGLTATPYDISEGQFLQASQDTYTSANITPTSGDRLIVAAFGSSLSSGAAVPGSWTNSFTGITGQAGGVTAIGTAYRLVTANGSTAYATGVSYVPTTPQTHSAMMIAFKVAAGGGTDQTVTAVLADGIGDAIAPTVASGATITTPVADGVGAAVAPVVAAGPITAGILDDFNRADGAVEAGAGATKWLATSHDGNAAVNQIESNTVGSNGSRGNLSVFTLPADFDIEFTFTGGPASGANLYVAVGNPGATFNGFLFNFGFTGPTNYGITRYTAGSGVGGGLFSTSVGPTKSVGARCRAWRQGTTLELYVDPTGSSGWTLVGSATDGSFYAPAPIELQCGSGANLDNLKWTATDRTVTAPPAAGAGDAIAPALSAGVVGVTAPPGAGIGAAKPPIVLASTPGAGMLDDFNRANGDVEAGAGAALWESYTYGGGDGKLTVTSNKLTSSIVSGGSVSIFQLPADFDVRIDVDAIPTGGYIAFFVALANASGGTWTGWYFSVDLGGIGYWRIYRRDSGSSTQVVEVTGLPALAAGEKLRFARAGNILTAYRSSDGVAWTAQTTYDTGGTYYRTGPIAIEIEQTDVTLDNLQYTTVSGDQAVVIPPADGTGAAPAVVVTGGAVVNVPPAAGTGRGQTPEQLLSSEIVPVPASGTGAAVAPAASTTTGGTVIAPPADGTGAAVPPAVTGTVNATVTAPPASGAGDAIAPVVTAAEDTTTVTAPPADATGTALPPSLTAQATVAVPPAEGDGDAPAPPSVGEPPPAEVPGGGGGTRVIDDGLVDETSFRSTDALVKAVPAKGAGSAPVPRIGRSVRRTVRMPAKVAPAVPTTPAPDLAELMTLLREIKASQDEIKAALGNLSKNGQVPDDLAALLLLTSE